MKEGTPAGAVVRGKIQTRKSARFVAAVTGNRNRAARTKIRAPVTELWGLPLQGEFLCVKRPFTDTLYSVFEMQSVVLTDWS